MLPALVCFSDFAELFAATNDIRLITAYVLSTPSDGTKFVFTINDGKARGPFAGVFRVPFEIASAVASEFRVPSKANILKAREMVVEAESAGFCGRMIGEGYVQIYKLGDISAQMNLIENVASKMECIQRLSQEKNRR